MRQFLHRRILAAVAHGLMKTQLIPLRVTLPTFILPGLLRNTSVSPFRVVSFVRIDSGIL
jgi:hypothetical protein